MIQENINEPKELEINEKEINELFKKALTEKFEMESNFVYIALDADGLFYYDIHDTNSDDLFTYTVEFYNEHIQVEFKKIMSEEDYEKYVYGEYDFEELGYERELDEDLLENCIKEIQIEFYADLQATFETEYIE